MAIDRFQNKNILTDSKTPVSNVQVYSLLDSSKLDKTTLSCPNTQLVNTIVEKHIYSSNTLIESVEDELYYEISQNTDNGSTYDIILNSEKDVRQTNVSKGYYSIVYNFVEKKSPTLTLNRISADSTELELIVEDDSTDLSDLYSLIQSESETKTNLAINFGDNNIYTITDISFNNNERVGEVVQNVPHPTSTYTSASVVRDTIFAPSKEGEGENIWIEFYTDSNGTTGRATKFTPIIKEDGNIGWEQEIDLNGEPQFYTPYNTEFDKRYNIVEGLYILNPQLPESAKSNRGDINSFMPINLYVAPPPYSQIRYYNPAITSFKKVVVKLYTPLPPEFEVESSTIDLVVRDSYIERLLVYPYEKDNVQQNFSSPNFNIDLGNYGKSQGTDLKTWNSLLDANLSTSQQIIDKYLSSSFGNINLNIDYGYFGNFVKYSSAVERVNNFKYKLELIESYDSRIKTLSSISGSEAITNISQSITRRDNVVSGMDGWERWMYHEATGSLYTHYSSSAYKIETWPRYSTYPTKLYSVTSSQGISHYNGLIESASVYDALNDSRLTKMIPASIVEDPLNNDYVLFVDMIGHHFDITWSYIKALTSINSREEHPYDGMPNELLYDVAKNMGWKLTHGKNRSELWNYAIGTDRLGNPIQSGSLKSKPHEQINYEVWRRIVNNIPYLLKTKGSARAVKALISTYGIPQTFLSIREYGGPAIEDVRHIWEHDKFVYHLNFDNDNYITIPWDKITDIDSTTYEVNNPDPIDTIELFFKQNVNRTTAVLNKGTDFGVVLEPTGSNNRGNIHFYLSGSSGYKSASITDISLFGSDMGTLLVQRENSVDDITQNNTYKLQYRRSRKDKIVLNKSASISIDGSTESSYNAAWTGSGTLTIGKDLPTVSGFTLWNNAEYMNGTIQEIRYWANPLKDVVVDEHTLSRESYHGNSPTSSYFDLKFRFIPDSQLKTVTNPDSIISQHPNRQITETELGYPLTASLFNFETDDLRGVTEEYYTKVPSAGSNNIMNNKVRVESNRLTGILDVDKKKEKSQYDTAPVDTNQVGIYMSATKMYNEDIYNHTGYFEIDDYIGNPDRRPGYTEQNEELDYVRRQVFKKYSSKNLINDTIDILARYDFSVFEQIRQTMPARVDYNSGILIEPHILERPKMKSKTNVSYTQPQYDIVIAQIDKPIDSEYVQYETEVEGVRTILSATKNNYTSSINITNLQSISVTKNDLESVGNAQIRNMYLPSTYCYTIPINYNDTIASVLLSTETNALLGSILSEPAGASNGTYTGIALTGGSGTGAIATIRVQSGVVTGIGVTTPGSGYEVGDTLEFVVDGTGGEILLQADDFVTTYTNPDIGYGFGWVTGSNGYWNCRPLGTMVTGSRVSQYASTTVYFYSTEQSASLRLSNSSSLIPAQVSTDNLPLAVDSLRYLGCKMTSDSLTTNSPDTPDGRPVVEVFQADPNVLIYTSQTADEGNLDVDTTTNLPILNLEELVVNENIRWQQRQEFENARREFRQQIQQMVNSEEARRIEFDIRFDREKARFELEAQRQEEFDIINRPDTINNR